MNAYDVFLSGPIAGAPDYRVRFAQAQVFVHERRHGARIWNPAVLAGGRSYAWYMRECIDALFVSALVVLLPGWESSPGALAEVALARALGIPCVSLDQFI